METNIIASVAFETIVYSAEKPEFIAPVREVALETLAHRKTAGDVHPMKMGGSMEQDPRIQDFTQFTAVTAGNILADQGYNTTGLGAYFESMWCQEHDKTSGMEQHTHPQVLIVGFYFLDVPDNSSVLTFHDPRPGKVATPLGISVPDDVTMASNALHVIPKPGLLVFTNSWLPHSVARNRSDLPLRFVHFNIGLAPHVGAGQVEIV